VIESVFNLPLIVAGPIIVGALCLYGWVGLIFVRRYVLPRLRITDADSGFCGTMQQGVMVFYGLAAALIVVNVWQNYSDTAKVSSEEAGAAAGLYRGVSNYPEPIRSELRQQLRHYLDYVIHQAWPKQQQGEVPLEGVELMNKFEATLTAFEPTSEGQKILHADVLRVYDQLSTARRLRLDSVQTRLPGVLWLIIIAGAFISLSSAFLIRVEDVWLQGIQTILLAGFIGIIIFLIFAFDRPYRGELGLRPDSYQLVYDQLMKQ
jgi:hypothetical protein